MDNLPLISIITTTYRRFDTLYNTIKSVLKQDYPYIEYIVSDDGSDNFPEKDIREYIESNKRKNIIEYKIIHHENNIGTVRNMNNAYKMAKGDYFINLSGDDVFMGNSVVSKIITHFLKKDCDVLVTSRLVVDDKDKPVCFLPHIRERKLIESLSTGKQQYYSYLKDEFYDMASGSAMYFSRRIMKQMNYYDESFRLWEDGPFIIDYTWRGKIECLYSIVSIRYQNNGISSNESKKTTYSKGLLEDAKKVSNEKLFDHYDELPKRIKRYVDYNKALSNVSGSKKIKVYLKYVDVSLSHFIYKIHRKRNLNYDIKWINRKQVK